MALGKVKKVRGKCDWRCAFLRILLSLCFSLLAGHLPWKFAAAQEASPSNVTLSDEAGEKRPSSTELVPEEVLESAKQQNLETSLFDLYLGDSLQGMILANYNDSWLEIENPADVLDQLKELKPEANKAQLLILFSGQIEKAKEVPGVGTVQYDLNTFRIIVELTPDYIKSKALGVNNRIPNSTTGFSAQQRASFSTALDDQDNKQYGVTHNTLLGYKNFHTRLRGTAASDRPYEFNEGSLVGYVGDYELDSGYVETLGNAFASSLQFTGVHAKTSTEILIDPEVGKGSKLEVFVPSRSRVEFYRDGRLLSVQILDFGLQEVNTSAFPEGSYQVDIVIIETNGRVTRDQRFFSKSGNLAAHGRPIFDLALGVKRDEFDTQSDAVGQGSARVRVLDTAELGGSIYGADDLVIEGLELKGLYPSGYYEGGLFHSTEGDLGGSGSLSLNVFDFSFGASATETFNASEKSKRPVILPTPAPNEPPNYFPDVHRERTLFFEDRSNHSITVSHPVGKKIFLTYRDMRERFEDGLERKYTGILADYRILEREKSNLMYQGSIADTELGQVTSNMLTYTYRVSEHWSLSSSIAYLEQGAEQPNDIIAYVSFSYDNRQANRGMRLTSHTQLDERSGGGNSSTTQLTNQLLADYAGNYLEGQAFLSDHEIDAKGRSLGLNLSSGIYADENGTVAVGGQNSNDAALIAKVIGPPSDAEFDVVLNGQTYAKMKANSTAVVGVSPFKTYKVLIRPAEESDLVSYDSKEDMITFFPGNVVSESWYAYPVFIITGRLLDKQSRPIEYERIRGIKEYTITENGGIFQAEINGSEELYIDSAKHKCRINLKVETPPEYFLDVGDVICE